MPDRRYKLTEAVPAGPDPRVTKEIQDFILKQMDRYTDAVERGDWVSFGVARFNKLYTTEDVNGDPLTYLVIVRFDQQRGTPACFTTGLAGWWKEDDESSGAQRARQAGFKAEVIINVHMDFPVWRRDGSTRSGRARMRQLIAMTFSHEVAHLQRIVAQGKSGLGGRVPATYQSGGPEFQALRKRPNIASLSHRRNPIEFDAYIAAIKNGWDQLTDKQRASIASVESLISKLYGGRGGTGKTGRILNILGANSPKMQKETLSRLYREGIPIRRWGRPKKDRRFTEAREYPPEEVYAQTMVDFLGAARIDPPEGAKTPGVWLEVDTPALMRWLSAKTQSPRAGEWEIMPVGLGGSLFDDALTQVHVKNNEVALLAHGIGETGESVPVDVDVDWYQEHVNMRPRSRVKIRPIRVKGSVDESVVEMATARDLPALAKWLNTEMDTGDAVHFLSDFLASINAGQEMIDAADSDPWKFLEQHPEINEQFAAWLPGEFEQLSSAGMVSDVPAWHFFTDARVVRNDIVVRRTNEPSDALSGWDSWEALAYTGYYSFPYETRVPEGWCFGFEFPSADARGTKYGDHAVVVRTSYVRVHHFGDNETQAIFPCRSAKVLGIVRHEFDREYSAYTSDDVEEPLFTGFFDDAVKALVAAEKPGRARRKESVDRRYTKPITEQVVEQQFSVVRPGVPRRPLETPGWILPDGSALYSKSEDKVYHYTLLADYHGEPIPDIDDVDIEGQNRRGYTLGWVRVMPDEGTAAYETITSQQVDTMRRWLAPWFRYSPGEPVELFAHSLTQERPDILQLYQLSDFATVGQTSESVDRRYKEPITEAVKGVNWFLRPEYYVVDLGQAGNFHVYYPIPVSYFGATDFKDYYEKYVGEEEWWHKVHTHRRKPGVTHSYAWWHRESDIPDFIAESSALERPMNALEVAEEASDLLGRLGFPKQNVVAIITNVISGETQTGDKRAGQWARTEHAIYITEKNMFDVDVWVHEWAHAYWDQLPANTKYFFEAWYNRNVIGGVTSRAILEPITDDELRGVARAFSDATRTVLAKDYGIKGGFDTILADPEAYPQFTTRNSYHIGRVLTAAMNSKGVDHHPILSKHLIKNARSVWGIRWTDKQASGTGTNEVAIEFFQWLADPARKEGDDWDSVLIDLLMKHAEIESAADTADVSARIDKPWGVDVRYAAYLLGLVPSEYAASNPRELWAVTVEHVVDEYKKGQLPAEVWKLLKRMMHGVSESVDRRYKEPITEQEEDQSYTLRAGTTVYHGTGSDVDFTELEGPAWVSTSRSVAQWFRGWHGGERARVLEFKLVADVNLRSVYSSEEFQEMIEGLGLEPEDEIREIADALCTQTPYEGWIIPNNYPDGDDILLCNPESVLEFVKIEESITEQTTDYIASQVRHLLAEWPEYHPEVFYEPEQKILFVSAGDWEVPENSHFVEGGYPSEEDVYNLLSKITGVDQIEQESESGPSEEEGNFVKITPWKAAHPVESVTEQVASGEWWIDDMGMAEYADGDIGDYNHAIRAFESMIGMGLDDLPPDAPELIPMEPIDDDDAEWLRDQAVDENVIAFLKEGGDPREWAIKHMGWIRLAGHAAEVWEFDDATLGSLRSGIWDAWISDRELDDEEWDTDVQIEEAKTRTLVDVPLRALMDDRYDAAALKRLGATGTPTPAPASAFMRQAWARKAAGERGIEEQFEYEVDGEPSNMSSIEATLGLDYKILPGVRRIPMDEFDASFESNYYAADDRRHINQLKEYISESHGVSPLIVVQDDKGYYVLEGGHRMVALYELGAIDLPAVVVVDTRKVIEEQTRSFLTKEKLRTMAKPFLTDEEMEGFLDRTKKLRNEGPRLTEKKVDRRFIEQASDATLDREAEQMLDRYHSEPTSIWLYTDMPVKDRVAWAYLAADKFKGVHETDLVERFVDTLKRVVDEPETFWQQIRERDATRAKYLDAQEWDIETVSLEDIGVYPKFSGFSDEKCKGNVLDTSAAVQEEDELPEKVEKLVDMADIWSTIIKFLPPILVPGGTLRGRHPDYEQTKWDIDDGNHRLVAAAIAGATEAVCFVGKSAVKEATYAQDPSLANVDRLLSDDEKYAFEKIVGSASDYDIHATAYYGPLDSLSLPKKDEDTARSALDTLEAYDLIQWEELEFQGHAYADVTWTEQGLEYGVFADYIEPEYLSDDPMDRAKAVFGVTDNFNETGYILADGSLLDFSGKREGGSPNHRAYDHRDIGRAIGTGGPEGMWQFMSETGAIRAMPEIGGLTIVRKPTPEQMSVIKTWAEDYISYLGEIEVEISKDEKTFMGAGSSAFKEFNDPRRFVGYIRRAFGAHEEEIQSEPRFITVDELKEFGRKAIDRRFVVSRGA
jgi:hypothetical protein